MSGKCPKTIFVEIIKRNSQHKFKQYCKSVLELCNIHKRGATFEDNIMKWIGVAYDRNVNEKKIVMDFLA